MNAAIDIGTNTVLMLIGAVENGALKTVHEEHRIPRLGKDVDKAKVLHPDSMQRVLDVLKEYKSIIAKDFPQVEKVVVTATSAVRDAQNRDEFIAMVKEETGLEIRLLSGDEEAQFTFAGAISTIPSSDKDNFFVLDIGGGSTEVALGKDGAASDFISFDMGCVRYSERFLIHNPPYTEEITECKDEVFSLFGKKKFKVPRRVKAVGVAGTMTSLAAIDLQVDDPATLDRLNGHVINREKLSKSIEIFSLHTYDELLELSPVLLKGREDIFLAGLLILESFLKYHHLDEIIVSTGGIRHGVLLSL